MNENIKVLRKKNGLNQDELAASVGVSVDTVRRWEKGSQVPRADELIRLASVLYVTTNELLNGSNNKIKITLSYDWGKYEEGKIDMTGNAFDLNLGKFGTVALSGAGDFRSLQDIDDFLADAKEHLVIGFEAQQKRGAIRHIEEIKK